jgi:hypothetical protein
MPRSIIRGSIRLNGVVLNELSTGTKLIYNYDIQISRIVKVPELGNVITLSTE